MFLSVKAENLAAVRFGRAKLLNAVTRKLQRSNMVIETPASKRKSSVRSVMSVTRRVRHCAKLQRSDMRTTCPRSITGPSVAAPRAGR